MKVSFLLSTRREFLQTIALGSGACLSGSMLFPRVAFAQDPPNCPNAPGGGTQFVPGSDTRPVVLRKPISALDLSEITKLQLAFKNLRALPSTDKRTWVLQADMHSLFCDQCNGVNMQIHGSWNFFPWHRAYLYYYERILGSLIGDIESFRLPYWDWENNRSMPSAYLQPSGSSNSLWDSKRDPGIAGGGALPLDDGTLARINILDGIPDFATFGGTSGSSGACEQDPHNIIHGDVGQPAPPFENMGNLGYAARDPIFFAHHCNIDKLWSGWTASGGTGSSHKNPADPSFLDARWSFYDENQQVVSMSAADVLDHAKNLRYIYQRVRIPLPIVYAILECRLVCCTPGPDPGPFLQVSPVVREANSAKTAQWCWQGVEIPSGAAGAFDIVASRRERRTKIGALTVLGSTMREKQHKPVTLVLDISKAVSDLLAAEKPASILLLSRHKGEAAAKTFALKAKHAELRVGRVSRETNPRS